MDSGTWGRIPLKGKAESDPVPWNLVYHSCFKLSSSTICLLWYDIWEKDQLLSRVLRTTLFNVPERIWIDINIRSQNEIPLFRYGSLPIVEYDSFDKVNRIIIFGGIDVNEPAQNSNKIHLTIMKVEHEDV
jgi:hypothetical protein